MWTTWGSVARQGRGCALCSYKAARLCAVLLQGCEGCALCGYKAAGLCAVLLQGSGVVRCVVTRQRGCALCGYKAAGCALCCYKAAGAVCCVVTRLRELCAVLLQGCGSCALRGCEAAAQEGFSFVREPGWLVCGELRPLQHQAPIDWS